MPEALTATETVEVPTDEVIAAIAYLFHLSDRETTLAGGQDTPANSAPSEAGCRLYRAAFGRDYNGDDELARRVDAEAQRLTREWVDELSRAVARREERT